MVIFSTKTSSLEVPYLPWQCPQTFLVVSRLLLWRPALDDEQQALNLEQIGMALTDGVSTVDTLVAVLCANCIGMTTVYHWQLWEPAKPKDWQHGSWTKFYQELHKLRIIQGLVGTFS